MSRGPLDVTTLGMSLKSYVTIDDPYEHREYTPEELERAKKSMMEWITMTTDRAIMTGRVDPGATIDTLRMTVDLSLRQLMMTRRVDDLVEDALRKVSDHLAHKVAEYIERSPDFDRAMRCAVAKAVQVEATKQVAAQIEDFVKEIIE